jgi:hypothetical protein
MQNTVHPDERTPEAISVIKIAVISCYVLMRMDHDTNARYFRQRSFLIAFHLGKEREIHLHQREP